MLADKHNKTALRATLIAAELYPEPCSTARAGLSKAIYRLYGVLYGKIKG
jgi:hypothetical protein